MKHSKRIILLSLCLALLCAACSRPSPAVSPTPAPGAAATAGPAESAAPALSTDALWGADLTYVRSELPADENGFVCTAVFPNGRELWSSAVFGSEYAAPPYILDPATGARTELFLSEFNREGVENQLRDIAGQVPANDGADLSELEALHGMQLLSYNFKDNIVVQPFQRAGSLAGAGGDFLFVSLQCGYVPLMGMVDSVTGAVFCGAADVSGENSYGFYSASGRTLIGSNWKREAVFLNADTLELETLDLLSKFELTHSREDSTFGLYSVCRLTDGSIAAIIQESADGPTGPGTVQFPYTLGILRPDGGTELYGGLPGGSIVSNDPNYIITGSINHLILIDRASGGINALSFEDGRITAAPLGGEQGKGAVSVGSLADGLTFILYGYRENGLVLFRPDTLETKPIAAEDIGSCSLACISASGLGELIYMTGAGEEFEYHRLTLLDAANPGTPLGTN